MSDLILVTYATRFGSTAEVAGAIAETLRANGRTAVCHPMGDVDPLDSGPYQAVLLGSAVNYGNWLPGAVDFVKSNREVLNQVPVALFTVHIQNTGDDELSRSKRLAYLDEVRSYVQPAAEGFFAGKFDRRGAAELLPGWLAWMMPKMDKRKWQKIHAWANSSPQMLHL